MDDRMNAPFFSIVIPTYNRADQLPVAIASVREQPFEDFEIVVVDDGSADNTRTVVESIGDARIRYHYQTNAGVTMARNAGAALARAPYLIFLDSDDRFTRGYLTKLHQGFTSGTFRMAFGFAKYYDPSGNLVRNHVPAKDNNKLYPPLTGAYAIDRELYLAMGGYDSQMAFSENTEFFLRLQVEKRVTEDVVFLVPDEGVLVNFRDTRERFNAYSAARYRSIGYFLKKHAAYFTQTPAAFVDYKSVYAVGAFQHGEYAEARRTMRQVIGKKPTRWKSYFQYLLFAIPALGKWYWRNPDATKEKETENNPQNQTKRMNGIGQDIGRYTASRSALKRLRTFLFHPGCRFMVMHRLCNRFPALHPVGLLARLWHKRLKVKFGFQIPYTTSIQPGFFLGHFGGIVINKQAKIGRNCNVAQGVTIGQVNRGEKVGCPTVGDRVWIGANAVVVGGVTIGNDVLIAPLTYINFDVPDHAVVIGNPAKIVSQSGSAGYNNNLV
ncbi:Serine acetyltransferase [Chryseolinea serpens]|uniref:Serine acetyltransferase n=1 Tax=Chryseolinea serpens TaxID=947013 RepID=A0A1M5KXT9_9BACT|nr:glycosyltransferase [Chryseolinea serpens]SHG57557.1 Serine acetyltransferase [Chryseolinea serpens]